MKSRRALVATIAITVCLLLVGCTDSNGIKRENGSPKENVDERFLCDDGEYRFDTVTDTKEGVVYLIWTKNSGNATRGGITVLLHKDGTPVTSEEVADER